MTKPATPSPVPSSPTARTLDAHDVRRVAVAAGCAPDTVRRYLADPDRGRRPYRAAIAAALRSLDVSVTAEGAAA